MLVSGVAKSSPESLEPPTPPPPEEPPRERSAGPVLAVAGSRPPLPGQHSSRRPFASKTLENITEASSKPLVLQTRAISLQPRVMKTSPGAMTATSASVARVLQPEPERPPWRNLEGEGRRKVNPRLRRHGGAEHELSGGALGVDPRGHDPHLHDPSAPMTAPPVAIGIDSFRALDVGVQGKREPRRWPLAPEP